ncbi:MAG: hypothetical protein EXR75_15430 [Myxococcales bacterium]|nr:hypothetical protein [Myxococcales bacterium]
MKLACRATFTFALISRRFIAGGALVALASGCALSDFAQDAASAGTSGGAICEHATVPLPPAAKSAPTAGDIWLAWRTIRFDTATDGGPLGLDLDASCTCQGQDQQCQPPAGVEPVCDLAEGRDNAAAGFIEVLAERLSITSLGALFVKSAEKGESTVLVRITGYNGGQNDDVVTVRVYGSAGFGGPVPTWSAGDAWPIDDSFLAAQGAGADIDDARHQDEAAYVTEGQLVAYFPAFSLIARSGFQRAALRLKAVQLTGKLVDSGGGNWRLGNGLVAARIAEADALGAIGELRDVSGLPVCIHDTGYPVLKKSGCEGRDIFAGAGGPTMSCDALSFAVAFEAEPAGVSAKTVSVPSPGTSCDAASHPGTDTCD